MESHRSERAVCSDLSVKGNVTKPAASFWVKSTWVQLKKGNVLKYQDVSGETPRFHFEMISLPHARWWYSYLTAQALLRWKPLFPTDTVWVTVWKTIDSLWSKQIQVSNQNRWISNLKDKLHQSPEKQNKLLQVCLCLSFYTLNITLWAEQWVIPLLYICRLVLQQRSLGS